ncbi:MAG: acyltransferase [Methylobacterium sp.]|uniref:acyltransferase family protein n=1 Tax=Methylobacterium sp. TaxID=409 RepID=UPI0027244F45|nr:acyltransferase [Methylobacterium sp.]MDO9426180.1 acyltransferase [Methylobacterium sp.]
MLNIAPDTPYRISPAQRIYLDFLRAVAATMVMVEHGLEIFRIKSVSFLGISAVTVFFLLSGFLITVAACRRIYLPGPQLVPFMIDRTARIYTPYVPAIALAVAVNTLFSVGHWGQPGTNTGLGTIIVNLLMLEDYPLFQILARLTNNDSFRIHSYNTAEPFWTVSIEYWIYFAFSLAFFVGARKENITNPLIIFPIMIFVPVVIYSSFANAGQCLSLVWLIGSVFGYIFVITNRKSDYGVGRYYILVLVGLVGFAGRILKTGELTYELQTIAFIAMCLFGIFMILGANAGEWKFLSKPIVFVASYSYSLYLVHNTIMIVIYTQIVKAPSVGAMILACIFAHVFAYAFYLCFERHHYRVGAFMAAFLKNRPARSYVPRLG